LKRPIPSFSIEIRKRPGRVTGPGINARLFETKAPPLELDRDSHRAAAAIFAPRSTVVDPASASMGRVLPVLTFDQPLNSEAPNELSAASESERETLVADRPTPKSGDGSALRRNSRNRPVALPKESPSVANYGLEAAVDDPSEQRLKDGAKVSARKRRSTKIGSAKRTKAQTSHSSAPELNNQQVAFLDHDPSPRSEDRNSAAVADLQVSPSQLDEAAGRIRGRTIWGRYVTGDELKPGERWKARLRRRR